MAFVHGKGTSFKLDNAAGTLTDISAYLTSVSMPRSMETGETTVFGQSAKNYIVGLTDATISFEGNWDSAIDTQLAAVVGQSATLSFEYGPAGAGTGAVKYTGEAILTSYETSNGIGDVVTYSGELQVSGAITRGTFA